MADSKLSGLPSGTAITNADLFYVDQDNSSKKITGAQLKTFSNGTSWINVKNFGATGDGVTDDTNSITNAIATIPTTGATLYFPAGIYKTTGGFTLANPTRIIGDGSGKLDSSAAITQIQCNSTTAKLFTVTADNGLFEHLGLFQTGGTATSGSSLVFINGANELQSIDYFDVLFNGGYDQADIAVGNSWSMLNCDFLNAVHWGARIRNTLNADAGDGNISGCTFYLAANAAAGIRWESSGGLRIINNKINANAGNYVDGLSFNCTVGSTVEWQVIGNNIEGCTGCPINITAAPARGVINGNILVALTGTNEAIRVTASADVFVGGNTFVGNNTALTPITLGAVAGMTIGPNYSTGFASGTVGHLVGGGTASNITDLSQVIASNTFDPANSNAGFTFSNGNLTVSATSTHATGAIARALRYGFQQPCYCEFKFTTIGSVGGSGVGFMNAAQDPHLQHFLGDTGSNSIGYYGDGSVFFNNATLTTLASYTTNDVISMHVNHVLKKVWFRKGAGGWNNDILTNQNPDLGIGGLSFATLTGPVFPAIDIESATGVCTADFGATAYAQTPSVSSGNW